MKVSVIGLGAYSLALATVLAKNNNDVHIWTESKKREQEYIETNKAKDIFDIDLPENISISNNLETVLKDTNIIYLVTASKYVDVVCDSVKKFYSPTVPVCIASKGIEESSEELLSNIVMKKLNTKNVAVISGPTFAIDIINEEPVALAIGTKSKKAQKLVMDTLTNDRLKLRPTDDLIGIQLCGSLKNIIAIAAGILKGLGYSDSTQAFLINESMHDIKDMIYYFGGKPKTILSFAGIGDLMLTCTSTKSRNFSFGFVIGSTKDQSKIVKYLEKNTVEGYHTLDTVYKMLKKKGIEINLINTIYDIVYNEVDPNTLAKFLIIKK